MGSIGFIGYGLPTDKKSPNLNVLNIMRALLEDKSSTVYIPDSYMRGSYSGGHDPRVHMVPSEAGRPLKVVDLVSNQERFNFSVTGIMDVMVEEEFHGQVNLVPKKIFRTYNIVRDGEITLNYVIAKLSKESFESLREVEMLYYNGVIVAKNHAFCPDFFYKVSFEGVPLVSWNWTNPVNLGLFNLMEQEIVYADRMSALKKLVEAYKNEGQAFASEEDSDFYTEAPNYVKESEGSSGSYYANCVVFKIPEFKNDEDLSEDTLRKEFPTLKDASSSLKFFRKELADIRFKIRCIVFAIETYGSNILKEQYSDAYPVPRSKEKFRQDATLSIGGKNRKLVREFYKKEIKV